LLATVAVGLAGRTRYLYGPPVAIVKEAGDPIDGSSLLLEVAWEGGKIDVILAPKSRMRFGRWCACQKANHDSLCSCSCLAKPQLPLKSVIRSEVLSTDHLHGISKLRTKSRASILRVT